MSVAERREKLIRILLLRGRTPVIELARELEVSERTILRDICALSTSHPISALPGRCGGVYLEESYIKNRIKMKREEIALLQKIISEIDKKENCFLDISEIQLLKDMTSLYSGNYQINQMKEGKK